MLRIKPQMFKVQGGCAGAACVTLDFVTNNIKIIVDFMQIILKNIPDFISQLLCSISNKLKYR
jgi:hypothetical protein